MRKVILVALLVWAGPCAAEVNWWRAGANAVIAADWLQTRYVAKSDRYTELNPMLGPEPSVHAVDAYFAVSALVTNTLGEWLPRGWGDRYYMSVIGWEGAITVRNHSLGVGFYVGF